jgi:hypothetical protein
MARPKKTARKAQTSAKSGARKSTTKTRQAKSPKLPTTKDELSAHIKAQTAAIKMLKSTNERRPPNNPDMPQTIIDNLNQDFNSIKELLDNFSQHLRALDRMRLNGVGIKKLGFINRAYELALENGEFLPHYLTLERFGTDLQYFLDFRTLVDLVTQIREKLWNVTIQSADIAYTDALDFYASVREAAKRRVDAAETLHNILSPFFKGMGVRGEDGEEVETEKKELRDAKSLIHGKHDGKIVIENFKPQLSGGVHKVEDQTFKDTAKFKGSVDGEVKE